MNETIAVQESVENVETPSTGTEGAGQGEAYGTPVPDINASEDAKTAAERGADPGKKEVGPVPETLPNEVPAEEAQANGAAGNEAPVNETVAANPLSARDYNAEWKELAEAHPEIVGTTLPEDIFRACIRSEKPPLQVYESMMLKRCQDEIAQLKQENSRLRQNAGNAQRAPVSGTAAGGSTGRQEEDPFVTAFRRYRG